MDGAWRETVLCYESIARTKKRKEITARLAKYLRSVKRTRDLAYAVYLSIARVSSESNGDEMNTGEHILAKAISEFANRPVKEIKARIKETGDVSSIVHVKSMSKLPFAVTKELLVKDVYAALKEITECTGKESGKRKTEKIMHLLARCKIDAEIKYIVRILDGKMKIGLSTQTVLCSLALAFADRESDTSDGGGVNDEKGVSDKNTADKGDTDDAEIEWTQEENEAMERVKEAYSQLPSFEMIIEILQRDGIDGLSQSVVQPGYPLRPMLSIAEKNIDAVVQRFKGADMLVEHKYDGERIQIHSAKKKITLFSRGMESTTERFAQVISAVNISAKAQEHDFIIDGEVVAYDRENHRILPFQVLSNRKRKNTDESGTKKKDAEKKESDIAVFVFDILYMGQSLTKLPILRRKEILSASFAEVPGQLYIVPGEILSENQGQKLGEIFEEAVACGSEGIMVKSTDDASTYEPSKRSMKWIKLKSDYIEGLHDTLDLIVIGAYTGKGKRTGVHGGFLLGCYNEHGDMQTVTKIGTGFTESLLESLYRDLQEYKRTEPVVQTDAASAPDVWIEPKIVWEVGSAGISLSSKYTAAQNSPGIPEGKGLSLRFPRFIRQREDKTPEDATSSTDIFRFYMQQGGE